MTEEHHPKPDVFLPDVNTVTSTQYDIVAVDTHDSDSKLHVNTCYDSLRGSPPELTRNISHKREQMRTANIVSYARENQHTFGLTGAVNVVRAKRAPLQAHWTLTNCSVLPRLSHTLTPIVLNSITVYTMPVVTTDKDLPKLLDTPTKQVKWAKKLVLEHLNSASKRIDKPPIQGMFSRTLFVALADGREVVVQFRTEPLDIEAFKIAKGALGLFVPDVKALPSEELQSTGAWAYSMNRMPGQIWLRGVTGKGAEGRIAINKSLGRVFSKGFLADNSHEAVKSKLRPHIDAILESDLERIVPYKAEIENYAKKLDEIAQLPLWVAHYDLNEVNVLINEKCEVTALIDWELSAPLPFGVGFGRIHTIAGEYTGGEFWMPDEFEVAERGFWTELFDGMPEHIRAILEKRIDLVQDSVILGTLLDCFFLEDGKVGVSEIALKALDKLKSYRIPFVRGQEPPYRS
ncbi:hypothetical protein O1611_g4777 [Lasiodiplodia mahajangana]|uniref:Uncharacterized protein n=1 Tax=Lasiodiplodia mahajangana TaxID=1108764 RepID=A0ACC2JMW6_9PEZI|nr:hypothetical protein O1611_g4777 [Lasiodiplodia mahajangana]